MAVLLGIDTGGTFTDAVIFDENQVDQKVLAKAKSLTTHHDLSIGIGNAIQAVIDQVATVSTSDIALVSMSTTLATNALVEGQGGRIGLVFIGFSEKDLNRGGLLDALDGDPVFQLPGGHNPMGDEADRLDLTLLEETKTSELEKLDGFAVVSQFANRNSSHETRVRDYLVARTNMPVTCGHELSAKLNGPKRAVTAAFNARLIVKISDLLAAITSIMEAQSIKAPLMVVRGDGSLVSAEFATTRPIETILSGPAASLVGAAALTGEQNAIISDIGGTTTDVAILKNGRPQINPNGATVGNFQTMVEAVDMATFGLGGDSETTIVHKGTAAEIDLGPRRAIPISLLALDFPDTVLTILDQQLNNDIAQDTDARFVVPLKSVRKNNLDDRETALLSRLDDKPAPIEDVVTRRADNGLLRKLIGKGIVRMSTFTPTDAVHCLGLLNDWHVEASEKAARLMARRKNGAGNPIAASPEEFSQAVIDRLVLKSSEVILGVSLKDDGIEGVNCAINPLIQNALSSISTTENTLINIGLKYPLIGLGASAPTYYPDISSRLTTKSIIPAEAGVANAVGAVAGRIECKVEYVISVPSEGLYRIHTPFNNKDFLDFDQLRSFAEKGITEYVTGLAIEAGAANIETEFAWEENWAEIEGQKSLISAAIFGSATGRPKFAN